MAENSLLLERLQIQPCFPGAIVADADDDTLQTGDVISMENYNSLLILISFSDGTATSGDITATLEQGTDIAFGTNKALNCLETGRIFEKVGATTLATGDWTQVTQATADEVYDDTTSGEVLGLIALEVKASDLDAANGYSCVRLSLGAITSAKLVSAVYILGDPKYPADPTLMKSIIA